MICLGQSPGLETQEANGPCLLCEACLRKHLFTLDWKDTGALTAQPCQPRCQPRPQTLTACPVPPAEGTERTGDRVLPVTTSPLSSWPVGRGFLSLQVGAAPRERSFGVSMLLLPKCGWLVTRGHRVLELPHGDAVTLLRAERELPECPPNPPSSLVQWGHSGITGDHFWLVLDLKMCICFLLIF